MRDKVMGRAISNIVFVGETARPEDYLNIADLFLFPSQDEKDWRARDKELSEFNNHTFSLYLSYTRPVRYRMLEKVGLNLQWDHIWFNYDDFRDLRDTSAPVGQEPLYKFSAGVAQLFVSIWF